MKMCGDGWQSWQKARRAGEAAMTQQPGSSGSSFTSTVATTLPRSAATTAVNSSRRCEVSPLVIFSRLLSFTGKENKLKNPQSVNRNTAQPRFEQGLTAQHGSPVVTAGVRWGQKIAD